ncbi:MAG TPA: hypothetical protein VFG68_23755 [Fimbriiglobus sp.]|nr:hypothetical protein [Fimbriiglobus sp.]
MRGPSPTRPARLGLEQLEARDVPASNFLAFGAAPGGRPLVEVFRFDGSSLGQFEAFETTFRGGVRAAAAELDGNANTLEVITAPGPGGGPVVRIFQIDLTTLARRELVSFLAFNGDFRGGLNVAAGNVAGPDARQEIIVAADAGGGPRVRVLSLTNNSVVTAPGPLGDFFALNTGFLGGVRVTAGELDGNPLDGDELVVAAGTTGGPRVQVFRSDGVVLADFFAFRPDFRGGVQVSFVSIGIVGRVQIDALALDPSQRNAALNLTSRSALAPRTVTNVGGFGVTSNPFGTANGGFTLTTGTTPGPGGTGTGAFGTGIVSGFGQTGAFTTGTTGTFTTGFGTTTGFGAFGTGSFGTGTFGSNTFTSTTLGSFNSGFVTPGVGTTGFGTTGFGTTPTSLGNAIVFGNAVPSGFGMTIGGVTPVIPGGIESAFTFFGDPGPLAPFPILAAAPFSGPAIGVVTTGFGTAVLV